MNNPITQEHLSKEWLEKYFCLVRSQLIRETQENGNTFLGAVSRQALEELKEIRLVERPLDLQYVLKLEEPVDLVESVSGLP